ncbi:hypothetical protein [Nocardioides mangrovicus]|uniref:hypothetical protein n=1 Tax=Nocardioides mangrovicus TaxID=2478913 RepID=UPI001E4ACBA6|nr:hypothetical protein [Nocardioides mangrovicus]
MTLPVAGLLAAWLGACLAGDARPEELEQALPQDQLHLMAGLDTEPDTGALSPTLALGALRRLGATSAALALPVPGDPVGLAGPAELNAEAIEAGEAVLLVGAGVGLVPAWTGDVVTWRALPAHRPRPLDPSEATTTLRLALSEATARLVELEVARWQPEIADVLGNLRHRRPPRLPRSHADRVGAVDRACLCLEIVALAAESEGGAVSAYEVEQRRQALVPLDRAARHALVALLS